MFDDRIQLEPPLYLIAGETPCWRCGALMPVVALLCENADAEDEGPFILSNIAELPHELSTYVQQFYSNFGLKFSKTAGGKYFANSCRKCGVISGDFFLHSEPGGPFFPTEPEEAQRLTIEQIPLDHTISVRGCCGYGIGDLIMKHAKKISRTRR